MRFKTSYLNVCKIEIAPNNKIIYWVLVHLDGLMQEKRNSIVNAMELRLSCSKPSSYLGCCLTNANDNSNHLSNSNIICIWNLHCHDALMNQVLGANVAVNEVLTEPRKTWLEILKAWNIFSKTAYFDIHYPYDAAVIVFISNKWLWKLRNTYIYICISSHIYRLFVKC